jgi:hypothetical protein
VLPTDSIEVTPRARCFRPLCSRNLLQVWSMKAPIWEFQYGDMMAKINASHHPNCLCCAVPDALAAGISRRRRLQEHAHRPELHHGVVPCPPLALTRDITMHVIPYSAQVRARSAHELHLPAPGPWSARRAPPPQRDATLMPVAMRRWQRPARADVVQPRRSLLLQRH